MHAKAHARGRLRAHGWRDSCRASPRASRRPSCARPPCPTAPTARSPISTASTSAAPGAGARSLPRSPADRSRDRRGSRRAPPRRQPAAYRRRLHGLALARELRAAGAGRVRYASLLPARRRRWREASRTNASHSLGDEGLRDAEDRRAARLIVRLYAIGTRGAFELKDRAVARPPPAANAEAFVLDFDLPPRFAPPSER